MRFVVARAAPVTMFVAPGPMERRDGHDLQPVAGTGVGGGRVHGALLVAGQEVGQVPEPAAGPARLLGLRLEQRLADPGDVAVAEDPEHAGDEAAFHAVPLGVLVGEEPHEGLGHGESHRLGVIVDPSSWSCRHRRSAALVGLRGRE